jgi:glycosyltransferase involved in cell wall biosynthesis
VVLPSRDSSEGFGMVLLEAAAAGRPVVGTAVGGIPAALDDGRTGVLVPPGDITTLARTLTNLVATDRDRAVDMGRAGRKRVEAEFSWPVQVRRHASLFEDVLG